MDKLQCYIVKDLLPLYADDVLSKESRGSLEAHLMECGKCREEYEKMTAELVLPVDRDIQKEERNILAGLKRRWTIRNAFIGIITAIVAFFLFFTVREYIMEDSELFQPKTYARAGTVGQLCLGELSDGEWTRLTFIVEDLFSNATYYNEPYLEFNNPFYEKQIINHGNSSTSVEIRILDKDGNVIIEPFTVDAGEAVSLEELEYRTPYVVEYRADGDFYIFTFI